MVLFFGYLEYKLVKESTLFSIRARPWGTVRYVSVKFILNNYKYIFMGLLAVFASKITLLAKV